MNIKHLFEIADDAEFRDQLELYLTDEGFEFPLDDFCHKGGYPEFDQLSINNVSRDGDEITCTVTVDFSEVMPTGCSDISFDDSKSCKFELAINQFGDVEIVDHEELWDGSEYGE